MAFHIVTNRCFLACEKVCSVVIEEIIPDKPMPRKKRKYSKKMTDARKKEKEKPVKVLMEMPKQFSISIGYYPLSLSVTLNSQRETSEYSLDLRIVGKKEAYALYAEIIKEVQEQHPSEAYLDKLVGKMLEGTDFKIDSPEEEKYDDD